jgi:hypothetical protein
MTVLSSPMAGQGLPAAEEQAADGKLDVRVRYQVFFHEVLGECDLASGYSASGNLVPRVEQDLLAAVVVGPGEGQGSAMSTCLVAVRLPRAVPR